MREDGRRDALERASEARRLEHISANDLNARADALLQVCGASSQTAHALAAVLEGSQQAASDIAGRSRQQNHALMLGNALRRPERLDCGL